MKLAVLMMVVLGMLAAGSAAIVVRTMRAGAGTAHPETQVVDALVARSDLPALTVVTVDHVGVEPVPRLALPKGHLVSPVQVIGKSLRLPVMKGQVITQSCLAAPGSGQDVVSRIPQGMRLFSVSVSSSSVSGGLLYPGCIVDIMTTSREGPSSRGQTAFATVLQKMQVWAVNEDTIVSVQAEDGAKTPDSQGRSPGTLRVSLLVDTKQAQVLQSAMNQGSIALVIRNPLDDEIVQPPEPIIDENRVEEPPIVQEVLAPPPKPAKTIEVIRGPKVQPKAFAPKEQASQGADEPNEPDGEPPDDTGRRQ